MPDLIPDAMDEDDDVLSYASSHASAPPAAGHGHSGYYRSHRISRGAASVSSNHTAISLPNRFHHTTPGSGASVASCSSEGDIQLKRDREREGRCSECGAQTHEWRVVGGVPTKIPLYVENEVHRGRCLLCHPLTYQKSTRSFVSISSCGQSVHSEPYSHKPDWIDSSSVVSSRSAIDEALATFDAESADLCDVIAAMRRHPHEPRIQEKGCEKLWIQSWDDENSAAIGRVGGIATILGAMRNFRENQHLQQCGCESIQNLANNEYNCDVILENGGIAVIVAAMNDHINVAGIQQCGCAALANLAGEERAVAIGQGGGFHAILKAAHHFADEESVSGTAHQALRALGVDQERVQAIMAQMHQEQQRPSGAQQEQQQQQEQQEQRQQQQQQQQQQVFRLDQHGFPISR